MWLLMASPNPAKFGCHRHAGIVAMMFFSLSHDLDAVMSPIPVRLVLFESTPLNVPAACQNGASRRKIPLWKF